MYLETNLGKLDGLDEYIEKRLAEKQKIIDEQQATIEKLEKENEQLKRQNKALKNSSLIDAYNQYIKTCTIQSKREESLNLKDYVETDERGHIVKVKLIDYIDDLIYERLNKKLEG